MALSRRSFIKIGLGGTAGAAAASGLLTRWWGIDDDPHPDPATDGERIVPTFCELCFWKCGVLAHVKDGRVTKLTGNPKHPLSNGRLCPRGAGGTGLLYDPDRLKRPLIRVKKRGEDVFEEVDWKTALDEVAENLIKIKEEHGPEALALFTHGYGGSWTKHLAKAYGTPNIGGPSYAQCKGPREAAYTITYGQPVGSPENTDMKNSRCVVLMGNHLGENMHNTQVQDMSEAVSKGADFIVVDPRFSVAAGKARYWLPIKPGGDTALLLAWMNVIINEKLYDHDYVEAHTVGFKRLKEHVASMTPEWAYASTGIKPALIRETARLMAGHAPATLIHPGRFTVRYGTDTQRSRTMAMLTALLGAWGRRGGHTIPARLPIKGYPYLKYPGHVPAIDKSGGRFPFADHVLVNRVCDASIPGNQTVSTEVRDSYMIKGWMVYATNLIHSLPDPASTIKAIQHLDFIVSVDVLPSAICGWSDVVLPESTYLERTDELWSPYYERPFVSLRQKVVEPMYDTKPGWWIAKELATRLGLEKYFPWEDADEYVKERIELTGLDYEKLKQDGVLLGEVTPSVEEDGLSLTFDTESGKIELYSEVLEQLGFDPMPVHYPPDEGPPGMFRLLSGRSPVHTFSRTTNNRLLASCDPENEVWINASVARSLPGFDGGLKNGERVILVNQDGIRSEPIKAKVTERIRGDCVFMVHGFGLQDKGQKRAKGRGAAHSRLVSRFKEDPIMGGTGMSVNFVRLEKAEEA